MPVNTRINLGLNTQASVDPEQDATKNPDHPAAAPWRGNVGYASSFVFCVMRYAPNLGALGSIVGQTGGHSNYAGNEVHRFDIATRLFAPLSDPYTSLSHPGDFFTNGDGVYSDNINGECHVTAGLSTVPTQPGPCHAYGNLVVIPPDDTISSGPNGSLLSLVRAARSPNASAGTADRTHIFDLSQGTRSTAVWARYATNLFQATEPDKVEYYGWGVYDATRKKVFAGIEAGSMAGTTMDEIKVLDCVTKQWVSTVVLDENVYQSHSNAFHWQANPDWIINFVTNKVNGKFHVINVSTGQAYEPGTSGTGPALVGGYDFVQSVNKLAAYEGGVTSDEHVTSGGGLPNRVFILTPPSLDPAVFTTTPWTWTHEDVTGPTPPAQQSSTNPHIGRFIWADKVKCFIWWADGNSNVQAWHVAGFT
jgi:hypothetical protein